MSENFNYALHLYSVGTHNQNIIRLFRFHLYGQVIPYSLSQPGSFPFFLPTLNTKNIFSVRFLLLPKADYLFFRKHQHCGCSHKRTKRCLSSLASLPLPSYAPPFTFMYHTFKSFSIRQILVFHIKPICRIFLQHAPKQSANHPLLYYSL